MKKTDDLLHEKIFRNYSKKDGTILKNINNNFVLRRKNKNYCPNCNTKNNLSNVYCKECGCILEFVERKKSNFNIKDSIQNINIKSSLKVSVASIFILFFMCFILKLFLNDFMGEYSSFVSIIDIILLVHGGSLNTFTSGIMNYSDYYNFTLQIGIIIFFILPVLALFISFKVFIKENDSKFIFTNSLGIAIFYSVILAIFALLSRKTLNLGQDYSYYGYNFIYGFNVFSVFFKSFIISFFTVFYMSIKKDDEKYNIYLDIFKFTINIIFIGYLLVFVLLILGNFIGITYIYEFGLPSTVTNLNIFVIISQFAAYIWSFANFNIITIGNTNLFLVNLFSTSISIDFKLCLIAFIALSALILFISGIKLKSKYNKNTNNYPVLIFSTVYSIFMTVIAILTTINISNGFNYNIQMGINVIFSLIISFLYSYIVTFIGFKLSDLN